MGFSAYVVMYSVFDRNQHILNYGILDTKKAYNSSCFALECGVYNYHSFLQMIERDTSEEGQQMQTRFKESINNQCLPFHPDQHRYQFVVYDLSL